MLEVNTSPGSKNVEEALRKNIVGEFIDEIRDFADRAPKMPN